ncbi:MAG TPA: hypothetical protein VG347_24060 [Verrucomicrobiae bacterium]|nr:hypothetical protein [Verrucomicrobiae bacterium]
MGKISQWYTDVTQWICDKLDSICPDPKPLEKPTKEEMRALVDDVEKETGTIEYTKRILHAKDQSERTHLRMEFERKMAERNRSAESQTR